MAKKNPNMCAIEIFTRKQFFVVFSENTAFFEKIVELKIYSI